MTPPTCAFALNILQIIIIIVSYTMCSGSGGGDLRPMFDAIDWHRSDVDDGGANRPNTPRECSIRTRIYVRACVRALCERVHSSASVGPLGFGHHSAQKIMIRSQQFGRRIEPDDLAGDALALASGRETCGARLRAPRTDEYSCAPACACLRVQIVQMLVCVMRRHQRAKRVEVFEKKYSRTVCRSDV